MSVKSYTQHVFKVVSGMSSGFNFKGFVKQFDLDISAGIEAPMINPDKFLEDKNEDLTVYDTMIKTDDTINGAINLKKKLILNVDNSVIPASEEKEDIEKADFVRENMDALKNPTFKDCLDNMLDAMYYGFKCAEMVWKNDGMLRWGKWKFMHPIYFDFEYDDFKNLKSVKVGRNFGREAPVTPKEFDQKFLYFVWPYLKDGNYYGQSDLSAAYIQYYAKTHIYHYRNVYLQNYGYPMPIVKYDADKMKSGELVDLKKLLDNFQDKSYMLIPSIRSAQSGELIGKIEAEFRDIGTSKGTSGHDDAIKAINKEIRRLILFPDKLGFTDDDKAGAFAMSKKMFDILVMIIRDAHERLENTINGKVRQLVDLNFANTENYPIWKFEEIDEGIEKEMLNLLFTEGVIDKREKWIRSHIGVPELSEKEKEEIEKSKEEDLKKQQELIKQQGDNKNNGDDPDNNNDPDNNPPNGNDKSGKEKKNFKSDPANPTKFDKIEKQFTTWENQFVTEFDDIHKEQSDRLVKQIQNKKIIENDDLKGLRSLRIKKKDFKDLFSNHFSKVYLNGKGDGITEINGRLKKAGKTDFKMLKVDVDTQWLDKDFVKNFLAEFGTLATITQDDRTFFKNIRDKALIDTGLVEERMVKIAEQTTISGLRNGLPGKTIISQIEQFLSEDRKKHALTIARTTASDDYNTGRMNFFNGDGVAPFIESFQYNAIIDDATTQFCEQHDGQVILKSDPQFESINPPNHFNCRSLLSPILADEDELKGSFFEGYKTNKKDFPEWGTRVAKDERTPAPGFGGN